MEELVRGCGGKFRYWLGEGEDEGDMVIDGEEEGDIEMDRDMLDFTEAVKEMEGVMLGEAVSVAARRMSEICILNAECEVTTSNRKTVEHWHGDIDSRACRIGAEMPTRAETG